MTEVDWLAEQFEINRDHIRAIALQMLGSPHKADDAVQEAWLRLSRSGGEGIENLGGWLTTVVARVCLDMLRSQKSRREESLEAHASQASAATDVTDGPEREALLADSVGSALLVVLDTLTPTERLAFVLHDVFAVPFDEIGPMVGRSPTAARQLASRARRRVQGVTPNPDADRTRHREVVMAFLAASRDGDFDSLLALLDPEAILRADPKATPPGVESEVRGATGVANAFVGRASAAQMAVVDGAPGAVWAPRGTPLAVFAFTIVEGKIVELELIGDRGRIGLLDVVIEAS
ncbi:MAG TPA: sigma-70 family RNA polymerase sigma factor [Acidimicrobiales bacterium]|jgi:RNA polymerase sigma-70 factor (ECF subfamily)|nr:sigma-70 family RNA polymerase sigma factor [Acidimicrobiales bacterium]